MNNNKWFFLAIILGSSSANALGPRSLGPVDGDYVAMTQANFYDYGRISAVSAGTEHQKNIYICAGNGEAKTPGKLINGNCYYANNGDEHKNRSYYMLSDDGYNSSKYKWVLANTMYEGASAITTRDWDAGDYIYHCKYNDGSYESRVGKYLPGTGKCYWSYYGDEKSSTDASKFSILVPKY